MKTPFPFPVSWFLGAHILAGVIALLIFLIPLLTKKGGKAHVRTGWVYVVAMLVVCFGAFLITPWRYFFDPNVTTASRTFSLFLFLIAFFTLSSLQQGIFVFKQKKRTSALFTPRTVGLPLALLFVTVGVALVGISLGDIKVVVFSLIGLQVGLQQINYWRKAPSHPQHWWFFHLENMFICCISTVTAFLVTAMPRIYPSPVSRSLVVWLAPGVLMGIWMTWFKVRYKRKFGEWRG